MMSSRLRGPCLAVILAVGISPLHAHAVEITPRVGAGLQDYKIDFADVTAANPDGSLYFRDGFKIGDHVSFVGGGLTVSGGRWFVDVSGQKSQTGHDATDQFEGTATGSGFAGGVGHDHDLAATFDRKEYNATLGWGFTPELSVYVGYKRSTVDLSNTLTPVLAPAPTFGDVLFLGNRVIDFKYDGAFIGASYSLPVSKLRGAFGVQSSLAFLNGTFTERFDGSVYLADPTYFPTFLRPLDPSFINGRIKGKSRGLNVGVSWTGMFSPRVSRLTYTLGVDRSEYQFDTSQSTTGNFEERNTRARLELRYRFSTSP